MKLSFLGVFPPDPLPSPAAKGDLPWREVMLLKSFSRRNPLRTTSILFRVAQLDIGGRTDRGTSLQILPPRSLLDPSLSPVEMENKDTREPKLGISLSMVTEEKLIFAATAVALDYHQFTA